ncbi:hypothetical protein ACFCV9_28245 [Streptomyces sp. NPDC056367]|uniref:hypothetical protein n=1 Tax=Streptomyces sp. NPDC056367 TaxID=3345797 RepID=UPI0035D989BD
MDVEATVQRVDAAARELVLRVRVIPRGTLGEEGASPRCPTSPSRRPRPPSATWPSRRTSGSRPRTYRSR